jgi:hypothetical protein
MNRMSRYKESFYDILKEYVLKIFNAEQVNNDQYYIKYPDSEDHDYLTLKEMCLWLKNKYNNKN